jgi:TRAP-type transport system periplasmic protein
MKRLLVLVSALLVIALIFTSVISCTSPTTTAPTTAAPTTAAPTTAAPTTAAPTTAAPTTAAPTTAAPTTAAPTTAAPTAAPVTLRFNTKTSPSLMSSVNAFNWMSSEIEKRSNGRVKIQVYLAGALAAPPIAYDSLVAGVMDINEGSDQDTAGRFPTADIIHLPFGFQSTWVGAQAINDWYFNFKPKEYDQTIILQIGCNPPALIGTANKPVRVLADIKGLSIRSPGNVENGMLTALGAVPRPLQIGEITGALSKGVIDGILLSPEGYPAFKLFDSIKYVTDIGAFAPVGGTFFAMNKDAWNKLSAADQQLVMKTVQDTAFLRCQFQDRDLASASATFKGLPGKEWITLSADELAKWKALANTANDNFVKNMTSKGLPGADYIKYVQERQAYWATQTPPPIPSQFATPAK